MLMNLSLHLNPSYSLLAIEGDVSGATVECVVDMLCMVPVGQPLVIDLSGVTAVDGIASSLLRDELRDRAVEAAMTIVASDVDVTMQLVLHNVDHCAQIVHSRVDAIAIATRVLAGRR